MLQQTPAKTLVLGVGNLLMSDDGVGLRVLERLVTSYRVSEEVQVLDGGTLGLDLLFYLEGVTNLLLVDAVEAHQSPGATVRLEGEQVPAFLTLKVSPHQIGVSDMLFAAKLKDVFPKNLVLWGIQPERIEVGLELSPAMLEKIDFLVEKVIEQLQVWGHQVEPKTQRDSHSERSEESPH
jgi:hydrogenase maturation protease